MLTSFETNFSQFEMLFREHLTFFFYQKLNLTEVLFCSNNFRIFRKDRNRYGGGIMFYVNENLPRKSLTAEIDDLTPSSQNEEFFISNVS